MAQAAFARTSLGSKLGPHATPHRQWRPTGPNMTWTKMFYLSEDVLCRHTCLLDLFEICRLHGTVPLLKLHTASFPLQYGPSPWNHLSTNQPRPGKQCISNYFKQHQSQTKPWICSQLLTKQFTIFRLSYTKPNNVIWVNRWLVFIVGTGIVLRLHVLHCPGGPLKGLGCAPAPQQWLGRAEGLLMLTFHINI